MRPPDEPGPLRSFNLADLFEIVAAAVPERLALVAGEGRLTYRELDERAGRLAGHLAAEGVEPGSPVAICAHNRAEWIEAMLGLFKLRAVPVNVNQRYVAEELRYVLEDAGAVGVLHEPELEGALREAAGDRRLRPFLAMGPDYEAALAAAAPLGRPARSSDDRYLLYTGGTTGMPKGVLWRHEDLFFAALGGGGFGMPPIERPEQLAERVAPPGGGMVPLVTAPMMHGGGQWMSLIALYGGGTVVLYTGRHFDPHEVWDLVARERVNTLMVVGDAMARPLAEALEGGGHDVSSVVTIGSGGAFLSAGVRAQLAERLPNAMIWDNFGASETGAAGAVLGLDGATDRPRFAMGPDVAVLDDDLRPVAAGSGVVGRLARRGHLPLGYLGDEARTAETFVTGPGGSRWVVPGDLATVEADGAVVLLGRGSVCVNTGGEKVFVEEVEAALKTHPAVFDAVVTGVPDERFGERVAAVVQPRDGARPSLGELQAHCRERLAGYKVPRRLVLVGEVRRTPAGKPDYRWARAVATG